MLEPRARVDSRPADFSTDTMLLDSGVFLLTLYDGLARNLASFVQKLFTSGSGEPLRKHKILGRTSRERDLLENPLGAVRAAVSAYQQLARCPTGGLDSGKFPIYVWFSPKLAFSPSF
jgi:hypothetical protein